MCTFPASNCECPDKLSKKSILVLSPTICQKRRMFPNENEELEMDIRFSVQVAHKISFPKKWH